MGRGLLCLFCSKGSANCYGECEHYKCSGTCHCSKHGDHFCFGLCNFDVIGNNENYMKMYSDHKFQENYKNSIEAIDFTQFETNEECKKYLTNYYERQFDIYKNKESEC
jgi:hypothetical protein